MKLKYKILIGIGIAFVLFLIIDCFFHDEIFKRPTFEISKEEYYRLKKEQSQEIFKLFEKEFNQTKEKHESDKFNEIDKIKEINESIVKNQDELLKSFKEDFKKANEKYLQSKGTGEVLTISGNEAINLGLKEKPSLDFYDMPLVLFLVIITCGLWAIGFFLIIVINYIVYIVNSIRDS